MRVSSPIIYESVLRDYPHARTEAELASPCTHFTLPGFRYAADVGEIRRALTQLCEVHTQSTTYKPVLLRPPLNVKLHTCFFPETKRRCRLVFDIDTCSAAPQEIEDLGDTIRSWLATFSDLPIMARYIVFCGRFADKLSYHVYFPDYCWFPCEDNRYINNQVAFDELNVGLDDYGLKADVQITSTSIKMIFMDKQLKDGTWRGEAQEPTGDLLTFKEYFTLCDAAVVESDAAWNNTINFAANARTKRRAVGGITRIVSGDTIEARILSEVPLWANCTMRHAHKSDGTVVIIPESKHCPLKSEPSNDAPAFEHAKVGRSWVVVNHMGTCIIRCHICVNKSLTIEAPAVADGDMAAILEKFNTRFAMLAGDVVVEFGLEMAETNYRLMTQDKFCKQEARIDEVVKIRTRYVTWPHVWLQLPEARRYPFGLTCDPSRTCDLRYYNTYRGMDRDVIAFADTVDDRDVDDLKAAYFPNWAHMLQHNICGDEPDNLAYIIGWLADCIQHPSVKRGVALILTGDAGAGKGLFARMLLGIFGKPHAVQVEADKLTGNWNSFIAEAVVVYADESEASRDKVLQSRLKMLITEEEQLVTRRYHDERLCHSFQHFIIASNNSPVFWQKGERRFACFDAKKRLEAGPAFFDAVAAEVASVEGRGALLSLLRRVNLREWVPQYIPVTRGAWDTQYHSMSCEEKYIYHILLTGNLVDHVRYEAPAGQVSIIHALCEYNAGDKRAQLAEDMGTDIFSEERAGYWYPTHLLKLGFSEMFPNVKGTVDVQLGKAFSTIFEDESLYKRQQKRFGGGRLTVFCLGEQGALRTRFCHHRGNLDERIFNEWAIA